MKQGGDVLNNTYNNTYQIRVYVSSYNGIIMIVITFSSTVRREDALFPMVLQWRAESAAAAWHWSAEKWGKFTITPSEWANSEYLWHFGINYSVATICVLWFIVRKRACVVDRFACYAMRWNTWRRTNRVRWASAGASTAACTWSTRCGMKTVGRVGAKGTCTTASRWSAQISAPPRCRVPAVPLAKVRNVHWMIDWLFMIVCSM